MDKTYPLILNLSDRGYSRQYFRHFVRKYCETSTQFAWSDTSERKVCFELDSEQEREECRQLLLKGLERLGVKAKAGGSRE